MLGHGAGIGYTGPGPPDGPHWQFPSGDGVDGSDLSNGQPVKWR